MTDGQPTPDWSAIMARAKGNGPGELLHELKRLGAWFDAYKGGFRPEHYPPEVLDYLLELRAPTGKRGRPRTTEWEHTLYRDTYEFQRRLFAITKQVDGREVDAAGNEYPVTGKPSDLAVAEVARMMHRSEGAALDAIFPERKARQRTKKKPPE
ncbi:MAG: hypothetical protein JNK92_01635 [Dechloromonas sp.]|nr:hypothetical protein [Dechloromonas sp.]